MKFLKNIFQKRKEKKEIESKLKATNYGRSEGWEVQYKNRTIAILMNDKMVEMFWCSYDISFVGNLAEQYANQKLFSEQRDLEYYSIALKEYAKSVTVTLDSLESDVVVYRLY